MPDVSTGTQLLVEVVRAVELAVCIAVAALLAVRWQRSRARATAAALGVFTVLSLVLAAALVLPEDTSSGAAAWAGKVLVAVLLSVPTLIVLFARALDAVGRRVVVGAVAALAGQVLGTLALPPLPAEGEPRPAWAGAYVAVVVAAWAAQSFAAAAGLWRAGRRQSSVVRHRMRSLAAGAVAIAITIILSGAAGSDQSSGVQVAVVLAGLGGVLLFALAFLLPPTLRMVWRQADLAALSDAERGLMAALTPHDVASTMVPVLSSVFGGAATVLDRAGEPVRRERLADPEVRALGALVAGRPADGPPVQALGDGVMAARLTSGWLVVRGGRLAPVFGDDEAVLLGRVATLVDLALERVRLFDEERASRLAAEAANAELETLLYSVSHDLRSPLISVLGYLDFLRAEHADQLTGDGPHYLERISVNALYMQSLISDLLELSRIGRSDPPASVVDLGDVVRSVVDGARVAAPAATVTADGALPRLRMSDVRARQLVQNLVDNALKHSGRSDVHVTIAVAAPHDGRFSLSVADDGVGVPEEYRTRVLRVFERLDAPKSSAGTGMGLAIVKRIAESVGGGVEIAGPAAGRPTGTTVHVTLPAALLVSTPLPAPRTSQDRPAPVEEPAP